MLCNLPDGRMAVDALDPIYGTDGTFLGTTTEGFTGDILVTNLNQSQFNTYKQGLADLGVEFSKENTASITQGINESGLGAEAFSNIYTHITKAMEGEVIDGSPINFDKLEGGIINVIDFPVDEDGVMGNTYGDFHGKPNRIPVNAEAATSSGENGIINVTTGLLGGSGQFNTVEHTQSVLGIHEYYGHGLKEVPGAFPGHSKSYQLQFEHKRTFNKLSGHNKYIINENRN